MVAATRWGSRSPQSWSASRSLDTGRPRSISNSSSSCLGFSPPRSRAPSVQPPTSSSSEPNIRTATDCGLCDISGHRLATCARLAANPGPRPRITAGRGRGWRLRPVRSPADRSAVTALLPGPLLEPFRPGEPVVGDFGVRGALVVAAADAWPEPGLEHVHLVPVRGRAGRVGELADRDPRGPVVEGPAEVVLGASVG